MTGVSLGCMFRLEKSLHHHNRFSHLINTEEWFVSANFRETDLNQIGGRRMRNRVLDGRSSPADEGNC